MNKYPLERWSTEEVEEWCSTQKKAEFLKLALSGINGAQISQMSEETFMKTLMKHNIKRLMANTSWRNIRKWRTPNLENCFEPEIQPESGELNPYGIQNFENMPNFGEPEQPESGEPNPYGIQNLNFQENLADIPTKSEKSTVDYSTLSSWLGSIGLGQHQSKFESEDYDDMETILGSTSDDLNVMLDALQLSTEDCKKIRDSLTSRFKTEKPSGPEEDTNMSPNPYACQNAGKGFGFQNVNPLRTSKDSEDILNLISREDEVNPYGLQNDAYEDNPLPMSLQKCSTKKQSELCPPSKLAKNNEPNEFQQWLTSNKLGKHWEKFVKEDYEERTLKELKDMNQQEVTDMLDAVDLKHGTRVKFQNAWQKLTTGQKKIKKVEIQPKRTPQKNVIEPVVKPVTVKMMTTPMKDDFEVGSHQIDLTKLFTIDGKCSFNRTVKTIRENKGTRVPEVFYVKSTTHNKYYKFQVRYD